MRHANPDKWADAMAADAARNGYIVSRNWLRDWLARAINAGRQAEARGTIDDIDH